MDVVSLCPLRTASILWRRARGEWVQTVVCKATFTLAPGVALLAEEQEDPSDHDNHWNDDPARSLYVPSDLVPWKPLADVILVGKAFAPRNELETLKATMALVVPFASGVVVMPW